MIAQELTRSSSLANSELAPASIVFADLLRFKNQEKHFKYGAAW